MIFTIDQLNLLVTHSINSEIESEELKKFFNKDKSAVYYKFLFNLLSSYKNENSFTVELGTYNGYSTAFLSRANINGLVLTIDILPKDNFYLIKEKYHNIISYLGKSTDDSVLDTVHKNSVDVCFFDTSHEYNILSKEFELWYPKIKKGGILLFDDIFLNEGMTRFWNELDLIKSSSKELHWSGFGYAIK